MCTPGTNGQGAEQAPARACGRRCPAASCTGVPIRHALVSFQNSIRRIIRIIGIIGIVRLLARRPPAAPGGSAVMKHGAAGNGDVVALAPGSRASLSNWVATSEFLRTLFCLCSRFLPTIAHRLSALRPRPVPLLAALASSCFSFLRLVCRLLLCSLGRAFRLDFCYLPSPPSPLPSPHRPSAHLPFHLPTPPSPLGVTP